MISCRTKDVGQRKVYKELVKAPRKFLNLHAEFWYFQRGYKY